MATVKSLLAAASAAALATFVVAAGCGTSAPPAPCSTSGVPCPEGFQCAARTPQCIQGPCGNGDVDEGEVCDDGGTINNDVIDGQTCNATCTSDETCGNGIRDLTTIPPEACDCKMNAAGEKECDPPYATDCVMDGPNPCLATGQCGNHIVDPPAETCDPGSDGIPVQTRECNLDCTTSRHGDGKINSSFEGEQCDRLGDGVTGDDCRSSICNFDCTFSRCGDRRTNPLDTRMDPRGEQCDDGDGVNGPNASCLSTCIRNVCGDGYQDRTNVGGRPVEECDLGAESATIRVDCPYNPYSQSCLLCSLCKRTQGTPHYCGDGITDVGHEQCDAGSRNGLATCPTDQPNCTPCGRDCMPL